MKIECKRIDCHHKWDYTGTKKYPALVNCPVCGNKARIPKERNT